MSDWEELRREIEALHDGAGSIVRDPDGTAYDPAIRMRNAVLAAIDRAALSGSTALDGWGWCDVNAPHQHGNPWSAHVGSHPHKLQPLPSDGAALLSVASPDPAQGGDEGADAPLDVGMLRCGQCGDDLLPEHVGGHLASEGRTLGLRRLSVAASAALLARRLP